MTVLDPQLRAGVIENAYAVSINSSDGGEQCGGTAGALGDLGVLYSASRSFSGTSGGSFSGEAESEVTVPGVEEAYAFFSATDGSDNVIVQVQSKEKLSHLRQPVHVWLTVAGGCNSGRNYA
jgi:hypothetical protein